MSRLIDTAEKPIRAYLVIIHGNPDGGRDRGQTDSRSEELARLAETLGTEIAGREIINFRQATARYGIGTGKADELAQKVKNLDIDCLIFDRNLNPTQQRNWERLTGLPVLDRQEVILQIFAGRAKTKEATLQVELAQLEHQLPRLSHAYIDLSRQRGGRYGTKGYGETKLELDRRQIQRRIHELRRDIENVRKQRAVQRKRRDRIPLPSCALVGYTNAGKSCLLNAMTNAQVLTEDKLFATLDPTTRRIQTSKGRTYLLTDTVGFIRDLPPELVDAFRSTLEELLSADLIIEVIDAADPDAWLHHATTVKVLSEIGAEQLPLIIALNKIDLVTDSETLTAWRSIFPKATPVSAFTGQGLEDLAERINHELSSGVHRFRFPLNRYDLVAKLHREAQVMVEKHQDEAVEMTARLDERLLAILRQYEWSP